MGERELNSVRRAWGSVVDDTPQPPSVAEPRPSAPVPAVPPPSATKARPVTAVRIPGLDPAMCFDAFVVGPSNRLAQAAALAVAEQQGAAEYNPLVLHGGVGLGKTHLLHAVGHAFARLHASATVVCVTSEQAPSAFRLEERLRSRFQEGLVVQLRPSTVETRAAILRQQADAKAITLPDEVEAYLAKHLPPDTRMLVGAVNRLALPGIVGMCASHFGVTVEDIMGPVRKPHIVLARQTAMYLAHTVLRLSTPVVARGFDKKDHSTVLYACNAITQRAEKDVAFKRQLEQLMETMRST